MIPEAIGKVHRAVRMSDLSWVTFLEGLFRDIKRQDSIRVVGFETRSPHALASWKELSVGIWWARI